MKTALLALTACLLAYGGTAAGEEDPASASESLLRADRDFARLSRQTDPKTAFAAYLAPNAIMLPRAGSPIEGYADAIASFGDQPAYHLDWQPRWAEVAVSGELGWTWGTYQLSVDGQQVSSGKYVNVWALQPDGSWKVRLDMGNQEPAQKNPDSKP
jgi:ketosteroid isomerase-like protein